VPNRLIAGVLLALALLVGPRRATADPRTEKAREHYLQGDAYYKLDKYREALGEYEQAYIAKPDPSFLYNIAQCHRLMGDKADAIKFYRRFLKDAPAAPNRAIAEKHIHDLESSLAHDPEGRQEAPHDSQRAGGSTATTNRNLGAGATSPPSADKVMALDATPPVEPAPAVTTLDTPGAATPEGGHPFYTRWWFWTAVGVVVVGSVLVGAAASRDPACPSGSVCK
jgi:tetratricopeptide (TPR) repeat protein